MKLRYKMLDFVDGFYGYAFPTPKQLWQSKNKWIAGPCHECGEHLIIVEITNVHPIHNPLKTKIEYLCRGCGLGIGRKTILTFRQQFFLVRP